MFRFSNTIPIDMKNKLAVLFCIAVLVASVRLSGQSCYDTVPNPVNMITTDSSSFDGNETWLICSGVTFTNGGGNGTFFLEPGANLISTTGGNLTVYMKSGSSFDGNATFNAFNTIVYEAGANIIDPGNLPTYVSCSTLVYYYTLTPPIGCSTTGVHEPTQAKTINVYPQPATQQITFEFDNTGNENHSLDLYDNQGRVVKTVNNITTNKITINTGALASGLYFYQLRTSSEVRFSDMLTVE